MTTTATMPDAPLSETTHPLAVEIAQHACRTFAASRAFHDAALARYEALPDGEADGWPMMLGGLEQVDIGAERACLDALLGLRPAEDSFDFRMVDRGNFGVVEGGVLYAAVFDRDTSGDLVSMRHRSDPRISQSRGVYRVHAVSLDQVLGLEPDRSEPPVPTAPPATTFGVGSLGWRVAYVPDFVAFISARPCLEGITCLPEPNGGAFIFTRLEGPDAEPVGQWNNLTAQYQ